MPFERSANMRSAHMKLLSKLQQCKRFLKMNADVAKNRPEGSLYHRVAAACRLILTPLIVLVCRAYEQKQRFRQLCPDQQGLTYRLGLIQLFFNMLEQALHAIQIGRRYVYPGWNLSTDLQ